MPSFHSRHSSAKSKCSCASSDFKSVCAVCRSFCDTAVGSVASVKSQLNLPKPSLLDLCKAEPGAKGAGAKGAGAKKKVQYPEDPYSYGCVPFWQWGLLVVGLVMVAGIAYKTYEAQTTKM